VYFLLACNVGEILIIFGAMLFGMPIPLRPVHLLWLNLVSDGAPALALGMEKGDKDIMKHAPRPPKEPVINRDMAIGIGVIALVDALAILTVFWFALGRYPGHLEAAQTMAFVTLCVSELVRAFTARSEYHSIFAIGFFSNKWMVWAVGASLSLVLLVVYVPFLQPFFDTVPLTLNDWLFMLPFFFASAIAMELLKLFFRSRSKTASQEITLEATSGGNAMNRVLVPVDGSRNAAFAVRHVVRQFMNNTDMEIHLLNVQPPLSSYVTRFLSGRNVRDYHHDEAEKALQPVRQILDGYGVPYAVHTATGERAEVITAAAHRLHCDHIVMSAARKNSLTRLVESSTTNRVLELTQVPVEIIAGDSVSRWERYGIPAGLGTLIALLFAAAVD
jgi:Ca2+-transporting ATPase